MEGDGNLEHGVRAAISVAGILKKHGLLDLSQMQVSWHRWGKGFIGFDSLISLREGAGVVPEDLLRKIAASQPMGHADTSAERFDLFGPGVWIDANGEKKREQKLVGSSLFVHELGIAVTLWVMHDIWSWYDFSGRLSGRPVASVLVGTMCGQAAKK